MASDTKTVGFNADSAMRREITAYQDEHSHDNRSDAVKELVEVGLREQSNPILYRMKDRVIDWASILTIAAVIVVVAGGTTGTIPMGDAIPFAMGMFLTGVALLAGYEVLRLLWGTNAVGAWLRYSLGGGKA